MKKSILAVCLGLAGFWSVLAEDSPIAAPGRVNEQGDAELPSGELLSDHVAEAEFTGMIHRKCRFLTSLCPDKCDHARDFAVSGSSSTWITGNQASTAMKSRSS